MCSGTRPTVLGASMMGVRGRVQREGDVIHVIARRLDDMSPLLASVGGRAGMGPNPRDPAERPLGKGPRDIYIPDLRLRSGIVPGEPVDGIKVRTRDFR